MASVAITTSTTGLFEAIHLKARDFNFLLRGSLPAQAVTLVVMDDRALQCIADPLIFWHPYYAEVITAAAAGGAKALGMDVALSIPVGKWEKDHDQLLAAAVIQASATMPVVVAFAPGTAAQSTAMAVNVNMLAAATGRAALPNLGVTRDDVVRNLELMEAPRAGSPSYQSLALAVAEAATGEQLQLRGGQMSFLGHPVPEVAPRTIAINYAGRAGTYPRVSLWDVVRALRAKETDKLRGWFAGRVVLLGQDRKDDRKGNPYYTFSQGGSDFAVTGAERCDGPPLPPADLYANMAGVEVHANAVATLLEGRYLRDLGLPGRVLVLGLIALFGNLAGTLLRGIYLPWAGLGMLAIVVAVPQALFRQGWMLATTELLLCAILTVIGVFLLRTMTAESRGRLFRKAISVFVSDRLAQQLESSGIVSRTGKREQVTIMFTDIRGFTAWCESKDPPTVVENLNNYFSAMVPCIVNEGGRVDKFIGDGIMSIFSREDEAEDHHALRAVRAGIAMVKQPLGDFKTGAGIHSGDAVVGAIGSEDKLDFTALGDTVNLASRLEGMNKEFKTRLLMSEETKKLIGDAVETVCLGEVAIRGKAEPLKIYTAAELIPKPVSGEA